jgi:hypothetical protein
MRCTQGRVEDIDGLDILNLDSYNNDYDSYYNLSYSHNNDYDTVSNLGVSGL